MPVTCDCGTRFWQQQDGVTPDFPCPKCRGKLFKENEDDNGKYIIEVEK